MSKFYDISPFMAIHNLGIKLEKISGSKKTTGSCYMSLRVSKIMPHGEGS